MTTPTPTPIETFEDILAALENNPGLRAALRQHVLDQEFLQLPAIVRELQQSVQELRQSVQELQQAVAQLTQLVHDYIAATDARLERLEGGQERLEGDVAELKDGQARLEGGQAKLESGQSKLESDVAELKDGQAKLEAGQAKLEAGQSKLESDVAELKGDVAELKAGQARMEGHLIQVDGRLDRLEGNMNRLIGTDYERKAARRASRLAKRYLGLEELRVIYAVTMPDDNRLTEILDNAVRAGRMSADEADELEETDIVMRGPGEYAVVEVSVTLDETDVRRARDRAGLLSKAVTEPVRAVVIGARALDSASQLAAANQVAVLTLAE